MVVAVCQKLMYDHPSKYLGDRFNGLLINWAVAGLSNGEPMFIGEPFVIEG